MNLFSRSLHDLDVLLNRGLSRRPALVRNAVRYGWALLLAVGVLVAAGGAVAAGGDAQEIVYATEDGSIVSLDPDSGRTSTIYAGDEEGFATGLSRTGGSRFLAFTVLRDDDAGPRGDLYSVDLSRGTRALVRAARPGEVLLAPEFSPGRVGLLANRYSEGSAPNALVLAASGADERLVEPGLPGSSGSPALISPVWTWEDTVHAWRTTPGEGAGLALEAHETYERRRVVLYETTDEVGPPAYHPDANALLFAEGSAEDSARGSRLVVLTGTSEIPVSGADGLDLYDPSPSIPILDGKMAVLWDDGERTGLGFVDPAGWRFEKSGVEVEPGSRYPHLSSDGKYLATVDDSAEGSAGGTEFVVRRLGDGRIVRRGRDLQPPQAGLDRMRSAGMEVPSEAYWFASANFGWRDTEGGYAEIPQDEAP